MTQKPQFIIVALLVNMAKHFKKGYAFPSQKRILELLQTRYSITMSRATLNRHLKALEKLGWFERIRRHTRARDGSLEMHSTLYRLSREAFRLFVGNSKTPVDKYPKRAALALKSAVSVLRQKSTTSRKIKIKKLDQALTHLMPT